MGQTHCAEVWHPSKVCLFQNICHLFHTIMQTFHTLGICFIPKWAFFIPCATFSYHFGIIKNVWYSTCLAQYRHSFFSHLYAHFSYPWHLFHTQMTCFHTWCKIFIPICYNQNHMVCNRLVSPGGKVWKMCPRYETSPQRYENKNLKVWNFFYKVWNFCIGVWKSFWGMKIKI